MANLTIANTGTSPTNLVSLGSVLTATGTLTLTSGIFTTTTTNTLTLTNTATAAVAGGSTTSFVNGPLNWTLPASLSASASVYPFPVGAGTTYLPLSLTTITTGATGPVLQVQASTSNAGGTPDGTIGSLSTTEFWSNKVVSGNFTDGVISLTRQTPVAPFVLIGKSTTQAGTYSSIGGTASGNSINNSNMVGAIAATNSQFYVFGTAPGAAPPALTAAVSATVDAPFSVTFTDDATWRGAITSITVGGTTLSPSAYSISAGQITFTPSQDALLQSAGTKSIVVIASGYNPDSVSQPIGAGADNKLAIMTQPTAPATIQAPWPPSRS